MKRQVEPEAKSGLCRHHLKCYPAGTQDPRLSWPQVHLPCTVILRLLPHQSARLTRRSLSMYSLPSPWRKSPHFVRPAELPAKGPLPQTSTSTRGHGPLPSSPRHPWSCRSRPGSPRGSVWGRPRRCHPLAVHLRRRQSSPGGESLQQGRERGRLMNCRH